MKCNKKLLTNQFFNDIINLLNKCSERKSRKYIEVGVEDGSSKRDIRDY